MRGHFVWYDLMTTDVEGAKAFYPEITGWKLIPFEGGDYMMWAVGEQPIGGVTRLPEEAAKMGAPPHWLAYTAVDDVDATCRKVAELGGKVLKEGTDIPNVGRFAVLADPQGAAFAVFKGLQDMPPPKDQTGEFSWHELNTTDWEAAFKFYSELFGWGETAKMEMGPDEGTYFMYGYSGEERSRGGMSNMAKQMSLPPHWMYYITVDDVDSAAKRVEQNGGKLVNGPMDIPGDDRIAHFRDPQGVLFALYSHKR
jgi:uncharacterized protein